MQPQRIRPDMPAALNTARFGRSLRGRRVLILSVSPHTGIRVRTFGRSAIVLSGLCADDLDEW